MRRLPGQVVVLAVLACGGGQETDLVTAYSDGDRRYTVDIVEGRAAPLELRVVPRGRWRLSTSYPVALDCSVPSRRIGLSEGELSFALETSSDSGGVSGAVRFGACIGERCEPVEHRFEVVLEP